MQILIATGIFPPDIGGPATYSKLLADILPSRGHTVQVLSFGSVRHLPWGVRHASFVGMLIWRARTADVVFAQDTVSVGLPALLASYLLGKPMVVRVPGDYAWEQAVQRYGVKDTIDAFQGKPYGRGLRGLRIGILRAIQTFVVRYSDRAVAPSRYFAALVDGWGRNDAAVPIYNGIDTEEVRVISRGVSRIPLTMVSAGRLVPWKGFDMLIRAIARLPGWRLSIAGDGPDLKRLGEMVAEEGLGDRVSLLGRLDRAETIRLIASADVFALNTRFESFSYQIVEAMAAGAPVITTNVGNLSEIIDTGVDGLLVEPDDLEAFVAAASRLQGDRAARDRIAAAGRDKASRFSVSATVDATCAVLAGAAAAESASFRRRRAVARVVRYLFAGGTAAATDLVLLYAFTDILGMWYLASSIIAFIFAFMVSFVLQKFFTFQDHGTEGIRGQAAAYLAVTGTNLALNTVFIYLLVQYTGLHYLPAQIMTSVVIAIESFIVYKLFIFRQPSSDQDPINHKHV